jgi:UDP:flavonoid glycosyltransferase YjiC (YdhE family)
MIDMLFAPLSPAESAKASADWAPPAWWPELDERRVIVVEGRRMVRPALEALAGEDVLLAVALGTLVRSELEWPENARAARYLPYASLMPKASLLLTSGGFGSVRVALSYGVPVVAASDPREPEGANAVQWSGVGVGIKARVPSGDQIRSAVLEALYQPGYRSRAERAATLMRELAAHTSIAPPMLARCSRSVSSGRERRAAI